MPLEKRSPPIVAPAPPLENLVWSSRNSTWATGDDRFSFPPVPGYTGFIPRSQDYFGKPYVPSTFAALADFKAHKPTGEQPHRIKTILADYEKRKAESGPTQTHPFSPSGCTYHASSASIPAPPLADKKKSFVSGYTGFIPQLRSHFGEPYNNSVLHSLEDFQKRRSGVAQKLPAKSPSGPRQTSISGAGVAKIGRVTCETPVPPKDLSKQLPVPGYRGHISGFIFSAEKSYGKSSAECITQFHEKLQQNKIARARDIAESRRQL